MQACMHGGGRKRNGRAFFHGGCRADIKNYGEFEILPLMDALLSDRLLERKTRNIPPLAETQKANASFFFPTLLMAVYSTLL